MCPMMIDPATTQVTTTNTSDGAAMVFTTTGDVNALRAQVRQMADMHNRMKGMHGGAMHEGMHGGMQQGGGMQHGDMHGSGMHGGAMQHEGMRMEMVPSHATVEDVPGGARLLLVPEDRSQLATLQQQARMHADMMKKGQCPMMAPPAEGEMHSRRGS
jgi:hypothetical protein